MIYNAAQGTLPPPSEGSSFDEPIHFHETLLDHECPTRTWSTGDAPWSRCSPIQRASVDTRPLPSLTGMSGCHRANESNLADGLRPLTGRHSCAAVCTQVTAWYCSMSCDRTPLPLELPHRMVSM